MTDYYAQIYQGQQCEIDDSGKILTEFDGIIYANIKWACL